MNSWSIIPAFAALLAGGSIFVLCREIRKCHKYIAYTIIFEGLFLMLHRVICSGNADFSTLIYLLYTVMMLASPLTYYFASIYLLRQEGVRKTDFLMLEAVAVYALFFLFTVRAVPQGDRNEFLRILSGRLPGREISTGATVMLSLDNAAYLFFLMEQLFVQAFCYLNLIRYRKLLAQYCSNPDGKATGRLAVIFAFASLRFVIFLCISLIPSLRYPAIFRILTCIVFCGFYAIVVLYICKIRYTAEELASLIQKEEKKAKVPAADEVIRARLETVVNERFYLNPDVDLFAVASKINVNSRYVSDYLKFHYSETFLGWTNRLRIEHAVTLMSDRSLTLEDIAEQSGFTTISTFYRNFSKTKGVAPSDYRKRLPESCK